MSQGLAIKLDVTSLEIEEDEEEDGSGKVSASGSSNNGEVSSEVAVPKENKKKRDIKVGQFG